MCRVENDLAALIGQPSDYCISIKQIHTVYSKDIFVPSTPVFKQLLFCGTVFTAADEVKSKSMAPIAFSIFSSLPYRLLKGQQCEDGLLLVNDTTCVHHVNGTSV